ncbi:MAG: hypothetical protein ACREK8_06930 [Gemmatimonadales bacterium]
MTPGCRIREPELAGPVNVPSANAYMTAASVVVVDGIRLVTTVPARAAEPYDASSVRPL